MFEKVLIVLVLVPVTVHCHLPYDMGAPIRDNESKLIYNLKEIIEKSIKIEREAVHKLHEKLSEKIKEALKQDKIKFHKQVLDSFEKIRTLEEKAQKQKVDIKQCLSSKEQLKQLPKEFYGKIAACDKDIVTKSKALAAKEKKTIGDSLLMLKRLSAELQACERNPKVLKCKAKVATEITQAVVQEPAKIHRIVKEALPTLLPLLPVAIRCSSKEAHELMVKEKNISRFIQTCISKKIRPHW